MASAEPCCNWIDQGGSRRNHRCIAAIGHIAADVRQQLVDTTAAIFVNLNPQSSRGDLLLNPSSGPFNRDAGSDPQAECVDRSPCPVHGNIAACSNKHW